MYSRILFVVVIYGVLQACLSRYLSLSVNLSLALSDERPPASLSADLLRSCMKETEITLAELNHFPINFLSSDSDLMGSGEEAAVNEDTDHEDTDYDSITLNNISDKYDEGLHCFAYCLYEQLGLVKNGIFMEDDFFRKLYTIMAHQKTPVKECMKLGGKNTCETAHRMHMCYSKLKTLEAERRIREILENDDNGNEQGDEVVDNVVGTGDDDDEAGKNKDDVKRNEIEYN